MATADILIAIIVLLSAVIGLVRGLIKEVLSLASWLAAFILALYFAPDVADLLRGQLADQGVRLVVAFLAVFVVTLIAGGLLQWLVGGLVKTTGLSGTDRLLGFLFGAGRGVLVCVVVLIALQRFAEAGGWWQSSELIPHLLAFEQEVLDLLGRAQAWVVELSNRG
ncbi:MAG: CvpA family protein [Pseudomonadales bacterium]|jgi:membrane protein required for colicin V production